MQVGFPKPNFIGFIITNVPNMNYNAISKMYGDDANAPLEGKEHKCLHHWEEDMCSSTQRT
jgi:hypothetical protein